MMKSKHRRQYLVDRISSSLSDAPESGSPIAATGGEAGTGLPQKLLAWALMLGVFAVPAAILLYLLNS